MKLGEQVAITKLGEWVAITKLGEQVAGNTKLEWWSFVYLQPYIDFLGFLEKRKAIEENWKAIEENWKAVEKSRKPLKKAESR
jgi:hypothetical protein